ncbi:Slp family lipoprotein [Pleionea sp. CnH1-48]|uniref:Slp family lipoprotein n=1 Tax=Pleionea sp. CnH1-48 TaxID=2954494 RepID=UPI0020975DE8|nr:Slp family lipoprotein [Pleionea sp. CnH1-48]MCO7222816.1 Slp family lipoprotein [Pleionea sp. CnH1-48]
MKNKCWMLVPMMLLLSACNTIPKAVQGDVTAVAVAEGRSATNAQKVRWGGVIARVENKENQSVIEVVAKPLGSSSRPQSVDSTGGRFLAILPQFIDPVVYEKGREITVLGDLKAPLEGKIGEMKYIFPVVEVAGHHLWKKRSEYKDRYVYPVGYWHFPYHYYHYPHYWRYHPKKKTSGPKKTSSSGK